MLYSLIRTYLLKNIKKINTSLNHINKLKYYGFFYNFYIDNYIFLIIIFIS